MNLNSQKRCREFDCFHENIKKPCLQDANSGRTHTTSPTPCMSLSTSLASQLSMKNSSVLELPPNPTDGHLRSKLACGQSTSSELSSFKSTQSHITSLPKRCLKKAPSTGAMQVYMTTTQNLVKLSFSSRPSEESVTKGNEENHQNSESDASKVSQMDKSSSHCVVSVSRSPRRRHTTALPVKTQSRVNEMGVKKVDGTTSTPKSKPNLASPSGREGERTKTNRVRRPVVTDDIDLLFTPDPLVYVVSSSGKTAKPKTSEVTVNSPTSEKVTSPATKGIPPGSASSCHMTPHFKVAKPTHTESSTAYPLVSLPMMTLKRVEPEQSQLCSENKGLKAPRTPSSSSGRQLKDESVESHRKQSPLHSTGVRSSVEMDTAASEQTNSSQCAQSLPLEGPAGEGRKSEMNKDGPDDVELDLGLSIAYEMDLTQSSESSEEEQLVSLQEMMEQVTKPPDTPEKGAFSEPSTPGLHSSQSKHVSSVCFYLKLRIKNDKFALVIYFFTVPFNFLLQILPSTTRSGVYKNNLDQMLKEINRNKMYVRKPFSFDFNNCLCT